MVESGRIDHAHHESRPNRAFAETLAFEAAVREAIEFLEVKKILSVSGGNYFLA